MSIELDIAEWRSGEVNKVTYPAIVFSDLTKYQKVALKTYAGIYKNDEIRNPLTIYYKKGEYLYKVFTCDFNFYIIQSLLLVAPKFTVYKTKENHKEINNLNTLIDFIRNKVG